MSDEIKTKTVDFIPEFGINGDFKKIVEYGFLEYNSLIMPVIALLYMDKGSNSLIPEMGLRDIIAQFPYSDDSEADALLNEVNAELARWTTVNCEASFDTSASNWDTGEITISIDITGIPAPLKVTVDKDSSKDGKTFKIVPPSVYK